MAPVFIAGLVWMAFAGASVARAVSPPRFPANWIAYRYMGSA